MTIPCAALHPSPGAVGPASGFVADAPAVALLTGVGVGKCLSFRVGHTPLPHVETQKLPKCLDGSFQIPLQFPMLHAKSQANELIPRDLASVVRERRWLHLRGLATCDNVRDKAIYVAGLLGKPLPGRKNQIVETLAPSSAQAAYANSLSSRHGLEPFPLHIDGAALIRPPHFIVLACECTGSTPVPTVLAHFDDMAVRIADCERFETTPFLIRNGRQSFYSTIVDSSRPFVRFDAGCMMPICATGEEVLSAVTLNSSGLPRTEIDWQVGDVLVIDNWRVLHGRGDSAASQDRRLLRICVQ